MFLDSIKIITENWVVFAAFIVLIAALYVLELNFKKGKLIFSVLNLITHTGLLFFCISIGAATEIVLLLLLAAILIGLLI